MQKSMKRLLSVLAVLALVLTMAPAGILAVETKAAAGDANLPEGVAATMAAGQAKQDAAKTAIAKVTGDTIAARLASANEQIPVCPFCGSTVNWDGKGWQSLKSDGISYSTTDSRGRHYYISLEENLYTGNFVQCSGTTTNYVCILMDNANVKSAGRILAYNPAILNIGGTGSINSVTYTEAGSGLFSMTGSAGVHELNIYGGTFTSSKNTRLQNPIIYVTPANNVVNLWTDDVVIGNATKPTADSAVSYNVYGGGTLNMYGGTIRNGKPGTNTVYPFSGYEFNETYRSGNVNLHSSAVFNMYGGTVKDGRAARGGNLYVPSDAAANIYGGTIEGGYATSNGGGIYTASANTVIKGGKIQNNKSVYTGGSIWSSANMTIEGALISGGESTLSHGGNFFVSSGTMTIESTAVVENGKAKSNGGNFYVNPAAGLVVNGIVRQDTTGVDAVQGGNIYSNGGPVTINGEVLNGHSSSWGGNIAMATGILTLGDGTVSGGENDGGGNLGRNIRFAKGTLKLTGDAYVDAGILLIDDANVILDVQPTFSGYVYVWRNGTAAKPGAAVQYATCAAEFPGTVACGSYKVAEAANGQDAVYIPIAMQWDGATGLEYAANAVVYNGVMCPAANAQAAVDEYVAAMADEEVEVKPQYVMVDGDVNIGENEVVIDPLDDIIVYGSGTVYGVDRANDNYAATAGSITVAGPAVAAEVTAGGRHFIALEDASAAGKYTFHRMEAALTNVTVNKDNAGMYYKAQYKFDAKVAEQVASYGVLVKLNEAVNAENYANKTTATDAATAYDAESATLTAKSHGVYGIFKTTNEAAVNVANGNTKLSGNPYIMIGDQMYTAAESTDMSLADAMVRANTVWEKMSEEDQANLNAFVSEWKALNAWSEDVLELLDNFTIA